MGFSLSDLGPYAGIASNAAVNATADGPYASLGSTFQQAISFVSGQRNAQNPTLGNPQPVAAASAAGDATSGGPHVKWYQNPMYMAAAGVAVLVLVVVLTRRR